MERQNALIRKTVLLPVLLFLVSASIYSQWGFIGDNPTYFPGLASVKKGNGDTLFAGGDSGVAQWTGNQWTFIAHTPVQKIAWHAGTLYAAGNFEDIEGRAAKNIAQWNGNSWQPLGTGVPLSAGSAVLALAVSPEGYLYVGGTIDSADGIPAHYLASWNGVTWDALGTGFVNDPVTAITCAMDGSLYVATKTKVFKRTSGSWSDISPAISIVSGWPLEINALAVDGNGCLYAGGAFPVVNGSYCYTGLIKREGQTWSDMHTGMRVTDIAIAASNRVIAVFSDDFMLIGTHQNWLTITYTIVGIDSSGADTLYTGVLGNISTINAPAPLIQCSMAFQNDSTLRFNCGQGVINHVNGHNVLLRSGLSQMGEFQGTFAFGIIHSVSCINAGTVFASGEDLCYNGIYLGNLATWDGISWGTVEYGNSTISSIKLLEDKSLCISAYSDTIGRVAATMDTLNAGYHGARYLDGSWSTIQPWQFPDVHTGQDNTHYRIKGSALFRWTGTAWDTLAYSRMNSGNSDSISFITTLVILNNGDLAVTGRFDSICGNGGGIPANNIAAWNGTTWTSLALPDSICDNAARHKYPTSIVQAKSGAVYISVFDENAYSTEIILRQDGAWERIFSGSGLPTGGWNTRCIDELIVDSLDNLYFNGYSHGESNVSLSMYDGTDWHSIPNPAFLPYIYNITNIRVLPDNALLCNVRANNGFCYIMKYSAGGIATEKTRTKPLRQDFFSASCFSGAVHITMSPALPQTRMIVTLTNIQGRVIRKQQYRNDGSVIVIPVREYSSGTYLLSVSWDGKKYSKQVAIVN